MPSLETILETDIFDQLCKVPYVQSEEDKACEAVLYDYYTGLNLDEASTEALKMVLQDIYVGDVVEKAQGMAVGGVQLIKRGASALTSLARSLQNMVTNRIVSEKFIRKRFGSLKTKYVDVFFNKEMAKLDYVVAPTYDAVSKRLTGLHNAVQAIKAMASSENISDVIGGNFYGKIAMMTNGVLTLKSSATGLVNNLVWSPPQMTEFKLLESPFSRIENIENLCNSVLFVKYKTMEGVDQTVKECLKRTKKLSDQADSIASYDVEDDTSEKYMHDYSNAYMVSKILKDVVKQGIQREINTIAISYVHKWKNVKKYEL